jgi:predicted GNAT superfamily acetyltransferase
MLKRLAGNVYELRLLDSPGEMYAVEELQRRVWPGSETDIVPGHLLVTAAHNGGLVIGAYRLPDESGTNISDRVMNSAPTSSPDPEGLLVGFVFGFPGLYQTADGWREKHCSHMLGVLPEYRDQGLGWNLKRAQWQLVRKQGIELITWTYDPLQSRNGYLNIANLGSVCSTYIQDAYGVMQDELNLGLSSDRFQVDWWVNSNRVTRRLSQKSRPRLDLAHYIAANSQIINPTEMDQAGFPSPTDQEPDLPDLIKAVDAGTHPILLVEIPSDITHIKKSSIELAQRWRFHTRYIFEELFTTGYLVTDFIYLPGSSPRSFYVLVHGNLTL